jgi:hypothetical protein
MGRRWIALLALVLSLGIAAQVSAHDATPIAVGEPDITLVLVERTDTIVDVDQGEPGPSAGDLSIWGPNPLYDEANETDTGATTQGICTAFSSGDCMVVETIVFPDGSTLQLQGIESGGGQSSTRFIVAGSGQYFGAQGTMTVQPSEDRQRWTKTLEIWLAD